MECLDARPNAGAVAPGGMSPRGCSQGPGAILLPLWLTEAEAEAVLQMCMMAPNCTTDLVEAALFGKFGELLRAFHG